MQTIQGRKAVSYRVNKAQKLNILRKYIIDMIVEMQFGIKEDT
jgi:hypothetical protein